jgi:hypothetical protein
VLLSQIFLAPASFSVSYDMNAAIMSLELHERGIHVVSTRNGWCGWG